MLRFSPPPLEALPSLLVTMLPVLLLALLTTPATAVKGPPVQLKQVKPHWVARLGEDVRLPCPVGGTPAPLMEWRKDGTQISGGWERFAIEGATLTVARVTADDAGVYVCDAVNGFGKKQVTIELFVIDSSTSGMYNQVLGGQGPADNLVTSRGRPPAILLPQHYNGNRVGGPLGSRLQLNCVTSGYPEPEVKWFKEGRPVLPSTRIQVSAGQLTLTQLLRSDDGVFICVARNYFGTANHTFNLQTSEPVSPDPVFLVAPENLTVYEGENAELQCQVKSISKAHIKWLRRVGSAGSQLYNQTAVEIQGSRYLVISGALTVQDGDKYFTKLTLPSVAAAQQGVYVCMAANDNGFEGREASIVVATAPSDSMQALLIALPAVAVVGFILGAICCLHRRRKTLPPPSDDKAKPNLHAAPPGGARMAVKQRYPDDGDRAVRTVLMPPPGGRACADGASVAKTYMSMPPQQPPPPAPYDYRQFRHLDVV